MPGTWGTIAYEILGYVPSKKTAQNEYYVALKKIQKLLNKGWSPEEVALIWNTSLGGSEKPHRVRGVNEYGVEYDSIAYAGHVMHAYTYLVD